MVAVFHVEHLRLWWQGLAGGPGSMSTGVAEFSERLVVRRKPPIFSRGLGGGWLVAAFADMKVPNRATIRHWKLLCGRPVSVANSRARVRRARRAGKAW